MKTAKFNLDTMTEIANFEQAAKNLAHDLYNVAFFDKPSATAEDMWEYETFQADQMENAWGVDEKGQPLALANDMSTARTIYLRVAKQILASR